MINHRWYLEVDESLVERVDQFLSSTGYNVFVIGDSHSLHFVYFHNSDSGVTVKYGKSTTGGIAVSTFKVYNTFEELIDAHFTGAESEKV